MLAHSGINCRTNSGASIRQSSAKINAFRKIISVRGSISIGIPLKSSGTASTILCGIFSQRVMLSV